MDDRILQFRVGVLVVATCIITAILVVLFGEWPSVVRRQGTIFVRFDEAPGVTVDTPVRKSGILIGRVTDVALRDDGGVLVTAKIDSNRKLRQNEVCRISSGNMLLGDAELEFVPSGVKGAPTDLITDGTYLDGIVTTSPLEVMDVIVNAAKIAENLEDDLTQATQSIQLAGTEVGGAAKNLNAVIQNNQDQLQRIMQKTEQAMDQFNVTMTAVNKFVGDDELRTNFSQALEDIPLLLDDAQTTLGAIQAVAEEAEKNLINLEGFTAPLGERGSDLVDSVDRSIRRLEDIMAQVFQFSEAINNREGSLGQFLHNPDLYQRLDRAVLNFEQLTVRLRPIVEDARIVADKLARNPGVLTSGVFRPRQSGIKWPAGSQIGGGHFGW